MSAVNSDHDIISNGTSTSNVYCKEQDDIVWGDDIAYDNGIDSDIVPSTVLGTRARDNSFIRIPCCWLRNIM